VPEALLLGPFVGEDVAGRLGVAVGAWLGARVGDRVGAVPAVQAVRAKPRMRSDAQVLVFMAR
jgi:hypothetical protein